MTTLVRIPQLALAVAASTVMPSTAHALLDASNATTEPVWGTSLTMGINHVGGRSTYQRGGPNIGEVVFKDVIGPFLMQCGSPNAFCAIGPQTILDAELRLATGTARFETPNPFASIDSLTFSMYDALLVSVPGATPTTVTTVQIRHHLSGTVDAAPNPAVNSYQFHDYFAIGAANGTVQNRLNLLYPETRIMGWTYEGLKGSFVAPEWYATHQQPGLAPWTGSYDVTASVTFQGAFAAIPFYSHFALVQAYGARGFDFGSTSRIDVTLPDGVNATSASGMLLTTPVSEAPAAAMLLGGLIAMATAVKRRTRAETCARQDG